MKIQDLENKIVNDDCMNILVQLDDNSVDVVITDPPYGVREDEWDKEFDSRYKEWLGECLRVSKYGVLWFCSVSRMHYFIKEWFSVYRRVLIWVKPPGSVVHSAHIVNRLFYKFEPILVFDKGGIVGNCEKDVGVEFDWKEVNPLSSKEYNHPTVKPEELMAWLIRHFSKRGQLVLDPFCGTGTTCKVCKELGRRYVGIEKEEEFYKKALLNVERGCKKVVMGEVKLV